MANKRMISKQIVDSDAFLDMPLSTQSLYFHLNIRADDDGFVNNPKKIMRMIGSTEDEFKVLLGKKFILAFESGVIVIKHWRIHNTIQKDRYKQTVYTKELKQLKLNENNGYTLDTECKHIDNTDKIRLDKIRLEQDKNKIKEKTPIPDEPELHSIFFDEISKHLKKIKVLPSYVDRVKCENQFILFHTYCKKIYPTKKAYKNYKLASITWIANNLSKMQDYNYSNTPQLDKIILTPEQIKQQERQNKIMANIKENGIPKDWKLKMDKLDKQQRRNEIYGVDKRECKEAY